MEFVNGVAVHNLAVELKEMQWENFVDASGIRSDVESGSLLAKQIRKAWELSNPDAKYYFAAEEKMKSETTSASAAHVH